MIQYMLGPLIVVFLQQKGYKVIDKKGKEVTDEEIIKGVMAFLERDNKKEDEPQSKRGTPDRKE